MKGRNVASKICFYPNPASRILYAAPLVPVYTVPPRDARLVEAHTHTHSYPHSLSLVLLLVKQWDQQRQPCAALHAAPLIMGITVLGASQLAWLCWGVLPLL